MKKTKTAKPTLPADFSSSESESTTKTENTIDQTTTEPALVEEEKTSPEEETKDESTGENSTKSEIIIEDLEVSPIKDEKIETAPLEKTTNDTEETTASSEEEPVEKPVEKVEPPVEPTATPELQETATPEPEVKVELAPKEIETPSIPSVDLNADLKIEDSPQEEELPPQEKRGNLLFIIGSIFGILILGGVITFSILFFKSPAEKQASAEPTATPTPQVTAAPQATLNKVDFDFEILNASGISGQAGKTQTVIEGLGYKVSSVGNANSQETGMKLLLKASLADQKDLLVTDLKKEYPQIEYSGTFDSDTTNARIIVGL